MLSSDGLSLMPHAFLRPQGKLALDRGHSIHYLLPLRAVKGRIVPKAPGKNNQPDLQPLFLPGAQVCDRASPSSVLHCGAVQPADQVARNGLTTQRAIGIIFIIISV